MLTIEINERLYSFNTKNIDYVLLGDGSLPSAKTSCVKVRFVSGISEYFNLPGHKEAVKLFKQLTEAK